VALFDKIISNRIEMGGGEKFGRQRAYATTVCKSTRARALPLFEVRWSGRGSLALFIG
jgi:hypothetical protein